MDICQDMRNFFRTWGRLPGNFDIHQDIGNFQDIRIFVRTLDIFQDIRTFVSTFDIFPDIPIFFRTFVMISGPLSGQYDTCRDTGHLSWYQDIFQDIWTCIRTLGHFSGHQGTCQGFGQLSGYQDNFQDIRTFVRISHY